jgi:hypothetical protein
MLRSSAHVFGAGGEAFAELARSAAGDLFGEIAAVRAFR